MPGTVLEAEDVAVGKSKSLPPGLALHHGQGKVSKKEALGVGGFN